VLLFAVGSPVVFSPLIIDIGSASFGVVVSVDLVAGLKVVVARPLP
jgi:hypothetical protein